MFKDGGLNNPNSGNSTFNEDGEVASGPSPPNDNIRGMLGWCWNGGTPFRKPKVSLGSFRKYEKIMINWWIWEYPFFRTDSVSSNKNKQHFYWLVVSTHLKNISQLGWLVPIYGKIKNVPNHQPVYIFDHVKHQLFDRWWNMVKPSKTTLPPSHPGVSTLSSKAWSKSSGSMDLLSSKEALVLTEGPICPTKWRFFKNMAIQTWTVYSGKSINGRFGVYPPY